MKLISCTKTKIEVNQKAVGLFKVYKLVLFVLSISQIIVQNVMAADSAEHEKMPSAMPFKLIKNRIFKQRDPVQNMEEDHHSNNHQQEYEFNDLEDRYEGEISYIDDHHSKPESGHK
jgi:hypothetical protein